jgi:hypothetical protein
MNIVDIKLDLYNAARNYAEHAPEDEAFIILCLDADKSNLMLSVSGDNDVFSAVAANNDDWLKLNNEAKQGAHEKLKEVVLNMALNIIYNDPELIQPFISSLANPQTK